MSACALQSVSGEMFCESVFALPVRSRENTQQAGEARMRAIKREHPTGRRSANACTLLKNNSKTAEAAAANTLCKRQLTTFNVFPTGRSLAKGHEPCPPPHSAARNFACSAPPSNQHAFLHKRCPARCSRAICPSLLLRIQHSSDASIVQQNISKKSRIRFWWRLRRKK